MKSLILGSKRYTAAIAAALTLCLSSCCAYPALASIHGVPVFQYGDAVVQKKQLKGRKHVKRYASGFSGEGGKASFYWQGSRTANGEAFKPDGISCAHKTLPFNTYVTVTNLVNGKQVTCRVNDRGPFIKGRVIDLSRGAARQIGMIGSGVVPVNIQVK